MRDVHGSQLKAANYRSIFLLAEVCNVLQRRWIPEEKVQRQRKSLVRSDCGTCVAPAGRALVTCIAYAHYQPRALSFKRV